jgi:hypothetical protein
MGAYSRLAGLMALGLEPAFEPLREIHVRLSPPWLFLFVLSLSMTTDVAPIDSIRRGPPCLFGPGRRVGLFLRF